MGCKMVGGGVTPQGVVNPNIMAATAKTNFCGQVGAAPGVVPYPDASHLIQGFWTHQRKKGTFQAQSLNGLVCGCNGTFNGELCGPDVQGTDSTASATNDICFSGVGEYAVKKSRKSKLVAFRAIVEDHADTGTSDTADSYTIQIWIPKRGETADGLAQTVSCEIPANQMVVRPANINEGGHLMNGDVTIRPKRTTLP
jgi:hypothetical protein